MKEEGGELPCLTSSHLKYRHVCMFHFGVTQVRMTRCSMFYKTRVYSSAQRSLHFHINIPISLYISAITGHFPYAGTDGSFVWTEACNWRYQARIPVGPDISHRGFTYTVVQTVQMHGVYSAVHGTVHYKQSLKSFEIRVGHSVGFGLPPVAILPQWGLG